MAPKRKAVSNVRKSESAMMKAETSRMKRKKKRKKQAVATLKKKKPNWDRIVEILSEDILEDITDPTTKTTKRKSARKKLDSDDPSIKGEAEAFDEYFYPGATKKVLRTRREQAYDSMRGEKSGGSVKKKKKRKAMNKGGSVKSYNY